MTTFLVTSGQTLSEVTLGSGDEELILPGGTGLVTIVNGGFQDDAGLAIGTTIYDGDQVVEAGGVAKKTAIYGGYQILESGGTASDTTVNGGAQVVEFGATAT